MPYWSEQRKVNLLTVQECCQVFDKGVATIKRWLNKPSVYKEYAKQKHATGASRTLYVDPFTLGQPVPPSKIAPHGVSPESSMSDTVPFHGVSPRSITDSTEYHGTNSPSGTLNLEFIPKNVKTTEYHSINDTPCPPNPLSQKNIHLHANDLYNALKDVLNSDRGSEKHALVRAKAKELGLTERSVYRYIKRFQEKGMLGLAENKGGFPKGKTRIPEEVRELVKSAYISNPAGANASQILRTLRRAVPEKATYIYRGQKTELNVQGILRIKKEMMQDPLMAVALMNEDQRKEFARVWQGGILVPHANHMWQMDMTRCDVLVVDPIPLPDPLPKGRGRKAIYRPRIQAIIDVFSGAIPGVSFSQDESQVQADLAMRRALFPKKGRFADIYPIHGIPETLYIDNGKIYTSGHFEGYMKRLNVQVIHSTPRVSHTRGKIERFFGTLHSFEKTLPGYVGKDAQKRDSEAVLKLYAKTLKWLESGANPSTADPMKGERLLTIDEYQNYVAAWLVGEYHATMIGGKTRTQHFIDTAPDSTTALRNEDDLMYLMGKRETRKVLNGEFKFKNESYWLPSGILATYPNGTEIVIIEDIFSLGNDIMVCRPEGDLLTPLGIADLAPKNAATAEARAGRELKKAQKKFVKEQLQTLVERYQDQNLRVPTSLIQSLNLSIGQIAEDTKNLQITTLTPTLSLEKGEGGSEAEGGKESSTTITEKSEFGKFLDEMEAEYEAFESDDPNEVLDHIAKQYGRWERV
jgi:putative transposase